MLTLDSFQKDQGDLIQIATDNTPSQPLTKIEELWRSISIPTLDEIVRYPAICLNKKSQKNTIIKTDENGRFFEYLDTPEGMLNLDKDAIQWTVGGRGKPKHNTQYFSRIVSCGEDSEHYTIGTFRHCTRPSCSACYPYTVRTELTEQSQRIVAMSKKVKSARGWRMGRKLHATVSVPPELYYKALSKDGFDDLRKTAVKIAQSCGIVGGLMIFHPFRQNGVNDDDDLPEEYTPADTNNGDKHDSRFAPHFHIVGFGWIDGTPELYLNSGWILKNIRTGKRTIRTQADIESIILYLRSHAGVIDDSSPFQGRIKTLTYFGACSPRSMSLTGWIDVYTPQICPECGAALRLYDVHGRNNDISPHGELMRRVRISIYSDRENSPDLIRLIKDNAGYPSEIVRYLDNHPQLGVMAYDLRGFISKTAPMDIQCLDATVHTVAPVCVVSVKPSKNHDERKTIRANIPPINPPAPDGGFGDYFPDYHYPPIPEGVY